MSEIKKELVTVGGKLRLKKDGGIKKKKHRAPPSNATTAGPTTVAADQGDEPVSTISAPVESLAPMKTKAELAFSRRQLQLQEDRVFKKAQMSHREKVERFNSQMNELTEFNDIPKVSWTK